MVFVYHPYLSISGIEYNAPGASGSYMSMDAIVNAKYSQEDDERKFHSYSLHDYLQKYPSL